MTQQLIVYFQDHYRVVDGFRDPATGLIDTGWLANELAGVNQFTRWSYRLVAVARWCWPAWTALCSRC